MEYTDIRNVFFTPHHVEHSCTKVIRGHCCSLGNSCTKVTPEVIFEQYCVPTVTSLSTLVQQCVPAVGPLVRHGRAHKVFA